MKQSENRICPQCGTETTHPTCPQDGFGTVDAALYAKHDPTRLIGTVFQGRYRVDALIGIGGMGAVYRASQLSAGRPVALKVINAELAYDLAVVARFQREGRAIASLVHPNIVQVHDFGQAQNGQLFMAMELVEGRTLGKVVADEGPLAAERVVRIALQLLDALAEAHDRGVIHRDLKPENIFISENARGQAHLKILDFGVAKIVNEPMTDSLVTARGAVVGSPKYMAPEQARGRGVTGHADLYAVGCIIYEMLTGRPVFEESSPADYVVAHSVMLPDPPTINGKMLMGPLVNLVMQMLEKKPWNRPDGAAKAIEQLKASQLMPLMDRGDNMPIRVEVEPDEQDRRPRRLVRNAYQPERAVPASMESLLSDPPPMPARALTDSQEFDADRRPRVVAAGITPRSVHQATAPPVAPRVPDTPTQPPTPHFEGDSATSMNTLIGAAVPLEATTPDPPKRRGTAIWWLTAAVLLIGAGVVWVSSNDFGKRSQHTAGTEVMGSATATAKIGGANAIATKPAAQEAPGPEPAQAQATSAPPVQPKTITVAALTESGPAETATAGDGDPQTEPTPSSPTSKAPGAAPGQVAAAAVTTATAQPLSEDGVVGTAATVNGAPEIPAKTISPKTETPTASGSSPAPKDPVAEAQPKTAAKPVAKPVTKPAAKPVAKSTARPSRTKAAAKPTKAIAGPAAEEVALPAAPAAPKVRETTIESKPSGAQVETGGLNLGTTPVNVGWQDSGSAFIITVTKPGHVSKRVDLSKLTRDAITIKLTPIATTPAGGPTGQ